MQSGSWSTARLITLLKVPFTSPAYRQGPGGSQETGLGQSTFNYVIKGTLPSPAYRRGPGGSQETGLGQSTFNFINDALHLVNVPSVVLERLYSPGWGTARLITLKILFASSPNRIEF